MGGSGSSEKGAAKGYKNVLLISAYPEGDSITCAAKDELTEIFPTIKAISTAEKNIRYCIGCNDCWIKTPGRCCIKDDYEEILIEILKSDLVIFLAKTSLGFVTSETKNLFDRILPIATMHLKFHNGQMRHYRRYDKKYADAALLFTGEADSGYLSRWLDRAQVNFQAGSLGAFNFPDRKGLYNALGNN